MGWSTYKLRPGETLCDYVRRDCPETTMKDVRLIAPGVVAMVMDIPARYAPNLESDAAGNVRTAGIVLFEAGMVKWMEELAGPYHAGKVPADMLAMLSPVREEARGRGFTEAWRARQEPTPALSAAQWADLSQNL